MRCRCQAAGRGCLQRALGRGARSRRRRARDAVRHRPPMRRGTAGVGVGEPGGRSPPPRRHRRAVSSVGGGGREAVRQRRGEWGWPEAVPVQGQWGWPEAVPVQGRWGWPEAVPVQGRRGGLGVPVQGHPRVVGWRTQGRVATVTWVMVPRRCRRWWEGEGQSPPRLTPGGRWELPARRTYRPGGPRRCARRPLRHANGSTVAARRLAGRRPDWSRAEVGWEGRGATPPAPVSGQHRSRLLAWLSATGSAQWRRRV
jgi:hypothetical protein